MNVPVKLLRCAALLASAAWLTTACGGVAIEPGASEPPSDAGTFGDASERDGVSLRGRDAGADARDANDSRASGCRSNAECRPNGPAQACFPPGATVCGGPAPPRECDHDDECGDAAAAGVCVVGVCGDTRCAPKCKGPSDCPGEACNATGHCVPAVCTKSSCGPNFYCPSDPTQGCLRKSCDSDAECAGACVNGSCWAGPGTCGILPV